MGPTLKQHWIHLAHHADHQEPYPPGDTARYGRVGGESCHDEGGAQGRGRPRLLHFRVPRGWVLGIRNPPEKNNELGS